MNNTINNYQLINDALNELRPEIEEAMARPIPLAPALKDTLVEIGPLPREALFLGLASDGLPVLLDLHDPQPGPILIAADPGSGKTALMQMIAQAGILIHPADELQLGVVTNYPEEWNQFAHQKHSLGIFPTYHNNAMEFLRAVSGWAHDKKNKRDSVLLLIDDLESMQHLDFEYRQILRWLCFRGPARRVWPIVSLNSERLNQVQNWPEVFRTRIVGHIKNEEIANVLTGTSGITFSWLHQGLQFAVQENGEWLKFWLPEI
jgi:hypothetical protein